jgi:membrane-associated protein
MIHAIIDFLRSLTDPEKLIALLGTILTGWLGYAALCGIVFAETGLLVGFFLPGDSLLFTVGVVCGAGDLNLPLIITLLMCSAILGDNVGYFLGRRAGPVIFSRPKSRFFHPDQLVRTRQFFDHHGGKSIIYARFIPIIRTCTPFIAGVARMPYSRFLSFSLVGGAAWIVFITLAGYTLGQVTVIRQNFEKVVLAIIFLSLLPVVLEVLKARRRASAGGVVKA